MKILKENGLTDDVMLSFRYSFQSEEICRIVASELQSLQIPFDFFEPSKRVSTYRLIIDEIQEDFFDPKLIASINSKFNIPDSNYDFFLGITSRFEIGGFSVPQNVLKSICTIGGKVEISYACS